MQLVDQYRIRGRKLRFGRGHKQLENLWDEVLSKKDLNTLLHQPNENLFVVDLDQNVVEQYEAEGMYIEQSSFYPRDEDGEHIIVLHTHPIGSLHVPNTDIEISSSDFPSLVDLYGTLDATIHYSKDNVYTPSIGYILGWGDYHIGSIRLISFRFTPEIISYLLEDEERIDELKENLDTAFNIVLDDKDRRENFSEEMYTEINHNLPYGMKVLNLHILEDDPTAQITMFKHRQYI